MMSLAGNGGAGLAMSLYGNLMLFSMSSVTPHEPDTDTTGPDHRVRRAVTLALVALRLARR